MFPHSRPWKEVILWKFHSLSVLVITRTPGIFMPPTFRKLILLFTLLLLTGSVYGQTVQGLVTDSVTREPVPFCSYILKGTTKGGITDEYGRFVIKTDRLPVTIIFNMMGYRARTVTITSSEMQNVALVPRSIQLSPVTISTDRVITWHAEDAWTFLDFEFYDDYLLALVSMRGKNREYLVLMDTLGETVATLKLDRQADSLFTDCLGAVQLFSGDSVYQVWYDYERLRLPYASSRETFCATMLPCRCQLGPYYYFSYSTYHGQKLDFYYINWYQQGKYYPFLAIHDSARIAGFNENYDIRYFLERRRLYHEYPEPVDSIVSHMDEYRAALPLNRREKTWLAPVDAPLARMGKQVYIVNPLDSTLCTYSGAGECGSTAFFHCMRLPGWQNDELYADELSGALYGRVVKQGYSTFIRIDPATGNECGRVDVKGYAFIQKARIRGGSAYFLWKDPYSDQPAKLRVVALY